MGLSIHYSGDFNAATSLRDMIAEVSDIAEIYKWKHTVFQDEFPPNNFGKTEYNNTIYGIVFSPPDCEPVWLCFLSNGKMSSPLNLKFYGNSKIKKEKEYLYMLSTKTQYAGIETHKLIIHLFKYLSGKYFLNFSMTDEGEYWETGDETLLKEIFERYTYFINSVASALNNYPMKPGENIEQYFERLMKQIHRMKKKP